MPAAWAPIRAGLTALQGRSCVRERRLAARHFLDDRGADGLSHPQDSPRKAGRSIVCFLCLLPAVTERRGSTCGETL